MSPEANKTLTRRFFDEFCNGRRLEIGNELFAADHTYHDPFIPDVATGPEGVKHVISAYHKAFPDAHWAVEEQIAADDTVVTRWTGSGTHQAELSGLAATGRPVKVSGIWIHRIGGDKIVESWNNWDALGMLQQLGVVSISR
jgi:steroid delta-isomerase-like uncharacterized protein